MGGPRFCTLPKAMGRETPSGKSATCCLATKKDCEMTTGSSAAIPLVTAGATLYGQLAGSDWKPSPRVMPEP